MRRALRSRVLLISGDLIYMIFFQMQWLKVCEIMGERLNLLVAERVRDIRHRRHAAADTHV